jgi:drug/metabolite transporter (DMT)-like permease
MMSTAPHLSAQARRAPVRPRLLAAVAVLGCATVYASGLLDDRAAGLVAITGGLAWLTAYLLLRREVQEAADLPDDRLDEREISLRNSSYLSAYRFLGATLALSLLLVVVEDAVDTRIVQSWMNPLAAMLLLSGVLPSIVLALTAPARVDPDE